LRRFDLLLVGEWAKSDAQPGVRAQLKSKPLELTEFIPTLSQQTPVYKNVDEAFRVRGALVCWL
jgi:hypothetical protein